MGGGRPSGVGVVHSERSPRPDKEALMKKVVSLRDGTNVLLRDLVPDDYERLLLFFRGLPLEDRRYLRYDVTRPEVAQHRIDSVSRGMSICLVAEVEGRLVGHGVVDFSGDTWHGNTGELRTIVGSPYQRRGLATLLIRELHEEAMKRNVERLTVRFPKAQAETRRLCEKLGFQLDAVLPGFVRDLQGQTQDLLVMTCALGVLDRQLRELYSEDDWPDG